MYGVDCNGLGEGRDREIEMDFDVKHSTKLIQYTYSQPLLKLSATPGKMSKEKLIMSIQGMKMQQ